MKFSLLELTLTIFKQKKNYSNDKDVIIEILVKANTFERTSKISCKTFYFC